MADNWYIANFIEHVRKETDAQRRADAQPLAIQFEGEGIYSLCLDGRGTPITLADELGDVPSPAYICADGEVFRFGATAREEFYIKPGNAARLSLHALHEDNTVCPQSDKPITMSTAISLLMKNVARDVRRKGYCIGTRLVVPVPLDLSDTAADRLRQAAQKAGLRLKTVPKNRAIAEYVKKKLELPCESFLLVHFSTDGVELSTVCCRDDEVRTNTTATAAYGYQVCENAIMAYLEEEFRKEHSFTEEIDPYAREDLLLKARSARKRLASKRECRVFVDALGKRSRLTLTYEKLCEKTASHADEVSACCENMLRNVVGAPTSNIFILGEGVQVTQLTDALEQNADGCRIMKLPEDAQAYGALLYYLRTQATAAE